MPDPIHWTGATKAWDLTWDAGWVTAVAFVPGTRRLVAGNREGRLLLWELPERPGGDAPRPARLLDGHTNAVTVLLPAADGRSVLSASYDHAVKIWDTQAAASGEVEVDLNPDARAEAERRRTRPPAPLTVRVPAQGPARTLDGHRDWVQAMCLTPDGRTLVTGDDTGLVIVWDLPAGRELCRWELPGWVQSLAVSPDGQNLLASERVRLVFSSDRHWGVKLWDPATGDARRDLGPAVGREEISAAAFSPDGGTLALGQGGETSGMAKVYLLDPATGRKLRDWDAHQYGLTQLSFTPDGGLVSSGRDTTVRVWDPATGRQVKQLGEPRGGQFKDWIHAFAVSADGDWLAAADMAGKVQVWHLPRG